MAKNTCIAEAVAQVADTIKGMQNEQERYIVLERSEDRRVAVIATKQGGEIALTLEVQLRLISKEKGRELDRLSAAAALTSALLTHGYRPGDQEEAWTCCEKMVSAPTLKGEIEAVIGLAGGC